MPAHLFRFNEDRGSPDGAAARTRPAAVARALAGAVLVLAALLPGAGRAAAGGATSFGAPDAPLKAYWTNGTLLVSVQPALNEGYIQIARRLLETPGGPAQLTRFNGNRPVMTGVAVKLPLALLKPELRGAALRAMYPDDEIVEGGWAHTVTDPLENLIQLTEAFTGSKRHFKELARRNDLKDPDLLPLGTQIVIPLQWIPEALGFRPAGLKAPLRLEMDAATGRAFALYTLEPDETLYAVLIRFTDQERADEINRLSAILVRLNKLKGPTRIPPGKVLRIPLEWISDDYLIGRPGGARTSVAAASAPSAQPQAAAAPAVPPAASPARRPPAHPPAAPRKPAAAKRPLPGMVPMHVILDAGHGGVDPGAVYGSRRQGDRVYEHDVVFDIALRLAQLLEARGDKVYPLVRNPQQIQPVETLFHSRRSQDELATVPPYPMDSVHVAVNLRVYLVDAIYRRLIRQGVPADRIVLLSIHGDALAASLRGAMVYYPDFRLRTPEFRPGGRAYRARTDFRARLIRFTDADNRAAQDASRGFAELVLQQFDSQQVRVSRRKSLRSFYYRTGVRTLPAVLRYSRVPQSILVEVANLNNPEDRRELLRGPARQRIAEGLAAAVDTYGLRQAQIAKRDQ